MSSEAKFCPLNIGCTCGVECGFYLEGDEQCSVHAIATALLDFSRVRGRVFTARVASGGRVTIPHATRDEMGIRKGQIVKILLGGIDEL